jgi:hypothetical protein
MVSTGMALSFLLLGALVHTPATLHQDRTTLDDRSPETAAATMSGEGCAIDDRCPIGDLCSLLDDDQRARLRTLFTRYQFRLRVLCHAAQNGEMTPEGAMVLAANQTDALRELIAAQLATSSPTGHATSPLDAHTVTACHVADIRECWRLRSTYLPRALALDHRQEDYLLQIVSQADAQWRELAAVLAHPANANDDIADAAAALAAVQIDQWACSHIATIIDLDQLAVFNTMLIEAMDGVVD